MPAVFDAAVGNTTHSTTTPLAWTHTTGASANLLLIFVNFDTGSTATMTMTCTVNGSGTGVTSLGLIDCNAHTTNAALVQGWVQCWSATTITAGGSNSISVASTGGVITALVGGSMSFTGYTTLGTPVFQSATGAAGSSPGNNITQTLTLASSSTGAYFFAQGNGAPSIVTGTSRFSDFFTSTNNTGTITGITNTGTGSVGAAIGVGITTDSNACVAVEVQSGAAGTGNAVLAAGTGAALNATVVSSNITVGPEYAGTATDLGGNYGAWATPQFAQGGP
jgi:hypothetical protein